MNIKKHITRILAAVTFFAFTSSAVLADINLGNEDGTDFQNGTGDNYWGVYTDSGLPIDDTEGLRVTVYDSESGEKQFNTIDITGNPNLSAVSFMNYFADEEELVPKTTWLKYVGGTYNSISAADMIKYNKFVLERWTSGAYRAQYVPELADIDIVSVNNTENLEAIRAFLGKKEFLVHLADLIGGGLTYDDIEDGKYKIAFEPVAYFRYNGQNWAMSATECGLLNKYMKNFFSAGWNSTNNLRALLGPLTHSNLPRSAFLESRELGIAAYSPTESDYYNGNADYNSDTCIIRCMGIGVLASGDRMTEVIGSTVAEYHTDTDVYTSFNFVNTGSDSIISSTAFSIYNASGELPATREGPSSTAYFIENYISEIHDDEGHVIGANAYPIYGYLEESVEMKTVRADSRVKVFVENPDYEETTFGTAPYTLLGTFRDGEFIDNSEDGATVFSYTIRNRETGAQIESGSVSFSCPADEEAMGWFDWHTPNTAQDIEITISSNNSDVFILDSNGRRYNTLVVSATIDKVEELTPPDPTVYDRRPSWHNLYTASSVANRVAQYASPDSPQTLEWYVWTYDWTQKELEARMDYFNIITSPPNEDGYYDGAEYYSYSFIAKRRGIDNTYYATENSQRKSGYQYEGAVLLSGEARKMTFSVSIDAELVVTPSPRCYTATMSNSTGLYTMKSGYGIQVEVKAHISGNTELCTGSQAANVLFPEFNYRLGEAKYNRLLEKVGGVYVFKPNEYSTYNDRVHFTPIWYPDRNSYIVYAEVFDVWCPAGQLSARMTDWVYIKGNVYDDWHIAPVNQ